MHNYVCPVTSNGIQRSELRMNKYFLGLVCVVVGFITASPIGLASKIAFLVENIDDPWPGSPYTAENFLEAGIWFGESLDQMKQGQEGELCAYVLPAQVFDASWTLIAELMGRGASVLRFEPGNPNLTGVVSSNARGVGETRMLDDQGEWKPLSVIERTIGCTEDPEAPIRGNGHSPKIISGSTSQVRDDGLSFSLNVNVELDLVEVVGPDASLIQCEVNEMNSRMVDCTGDIQTEELMNLRAFLMMVTDSGRLTAFDLRDAYYLIKN